MPNLHRGGAERQPALPRVASSLVPSVQLRDLARRVRRLGHGDRHNPIESFVLSKLELAAELDRLADRAEGAR